jgi:dTDP-4-dehydrorhamnose reductase
MRIVIVGAGGRLGAALMRPYREKFDVVAFNHSQLDLGNPQQVREKLSPLDFDLLINCAAFTNVDLCEKERNQAFAINANAPKLLAEVCAAKKAKLIHFSTDYVFDGENREPYTEEDAAKPISVYGKSKRGGEKCVLEVSDCHLVVRVSWVFGPDRPSFIDAMIKRAREEEQVNAIADKWSTPTYTSDIAEMLPRLFDVDAGVVHLTDSGQCTWQEYAQHALDCCAKAGVSLKATTVAPLKLAEMKNWVARRPVHSVLSTAKYQALTGSAPRSWRDAVADYIERSYSKK